MRMPAVVAAMLACALALLLPPAAAYPEDRPTVFIGTGGIMWDYVDEATTPNLFRFSNRADLGALNVRGAHPRACPADGWLTLGSGERAGDGVTDSGTCRVLDEPVDGRVPHWDEYEKAAERSAYDPELGRLGELTDSIETLALGPGAAIALADSDGHIDDYGRVDDLARLAPGKDLVLVDLGALTEDEPRVFESTQVRPTADPPSVNFTGPDWDEGRIRAGMRELDERLGAVLADVEQALPGADIIIASLADYGEPSTLQVMMRGSDEPGLLTSQATRRAGLVTSTDLLPTLAEQADGQGVTSIEGSSPDANRSAVTDLTELNQSIRPATGPMYVSWGVLWGLTLIAALILRRGGALHTAALAAAGFPAASVAMNLLPWHEAGHPTATLIAGSLLLSAALGAGAHSARRFGGEVPAGIIAGLTLVAFLGAILLGSTLALDSVFGAQPQVGRFYGMTNMMFAISASAGLVLAGVLAERVTDRRRAALLIGLVGAAVIIVDGSPWHGADFGGPAVLTFAYLLLILLVLGVRITVVKAIGMAVAGVAVTAVFAGIDYLRPPDQRTHLGDFAESVLDGSAMTVIARKALQVAGLWPLILALVLVAVGIIVLVRARGMRIGNPLSPDGSVWSWVAAALAVALVGGMLLNDSGPIIVLVGALVAIPLIASAGMGDRQGSRPRGEPADGQTARTR